MIYFFSDRKCLIVLFANSSLLALILCTLNKFDCDKMTVLVLTEKFGSGWVSYHESERKKRIDE